MFQIFALLLLCEIIILVTIIFVFNYSNRSRFHSKSTIQFNIVLLAVFAVVQFIVLDYMINPKTAIHYDGILSDKQIKLETETKLIGR